MKRELGRCFIVIHKLGCLADTERARLNAPPFAGFGTLITVLTALHIVEVFGRLLSPLARPFSAKKLVVSAVSAAELRAGRRAFLGAPVPPRALARQRRTAHETAIVGYELMGVNG